MNTAEENPSKIFFIILFLFQTFFFANWYLLQGIVFEWLEKDMGNKIEIASNFIFLNNLVKYFTFKIDPFC